MRVEKKAKAAGHPEKFRQRNRPVRLTIALKLVLGVAGDHRRDDAVHGNPRPIEEERVQCAAVDGPLDGLADADVVQG